MADSAAPVIIYSTPSCQQCKRTKAQLEKYGVPHEYVLVTDLPDDEAERVRSFGTSAPLVEVPQDARYGSMAGEHWNGLLPDRLEALRAAYAA